MDLSRPLVSIIMPVYNAEQYLQKSIESVINQTVPNWELILVDDGSTDGSGKICDEYRSKDERIQVIHQVNQGVSVARNTGIHTSNGKWIHFLDSDDFISNEFLRIMLSKTKGVDMVVCSIRNYPAKTVIKLENRVYCDVIDTAENFDLLYNAGFYNSPTTKLYKKSKILREFPEEISLGEDLIFNLQYMRNCKKICVIDEPLYYCRIDSANSLTKQTRKNISEIWEKMISEILVTFPNKKNVRTAVYKRFVETMNYKYLVLTKNECYNFQEKIEIMKTWGASKLYRVEAADGLDFKHRCVWWLVCKKMYMIVYVLGLIYTP